MWKLLRKDWLLNRRALLLAYLVWSALWLGLPLMEYGEEFSLGAWTGFVSVACAFLPIVVVGREDKFRAAALACSLPVTRRDIVKARYLGGWLLAIAAAAVALGAMLLLSSAAGWPFGRPPLAIPIVIVVVIGLVLGATMPFVLRFGLVGLIGFLVALQLLGIVVLLASAIFDSNGVSSLVRGFATAVSGSYRALGAATFYAAALAAIAVLNFASYRLSVFVYGSREF